MFEVKALECKNCGGSIDRRTMKCPYCDTQYERDGNGGLVESHIPILQIPSNVQTFHVAAKVRLEMLRDPEMAQKYVKDRMAKELAKVVADNMEIVEERSHYDFSNIYKGVIRIVAPERRKP